MINELDSLKSKLSEISQRIGELQTSLDILKTYILNSSYDEYGGFVLLKGQETGFFHVEKINGKLWLVDPEGHLFISKGVNHVDYLGDYAPSLGYSPYNRIVSSKYGSADAWAEETVKRLQSWGFNTVGAWSSEETFTKKMPFTIVLNIAAQAGSDWLSGKVADYFTEDFEKVADDVAEKVCASERDDPYLIGYFTDNELRWTADWRSTRELLDDYMLFPHDAEGKRSVVKYLKGKYISISSLNEAWNASFSSFEEILSAYEAPKSTAVDSDRLGFLEVASKRYFQVCYEAIKKHDPNHLVLGCRYAFKPPDEAIKGCRGYVDVFSVNRYTNPYSEDLRTFLENLEEIHSFIELPVMITEFSFKAMDSDLPNTRGAGVPVKSQAERARFYEEYVRTILAEPFVVGYHWFQYADQPSEGRFDGENSNFGLVNIRDEPWIILVERAAAVNLQAEYMHASGQKS